MTQFSFLLQPNSSPMSNCTEEDFLRQYNGKQVKIERRENGGKGNFIHTRDGDLRPAVYLTHHAKQRINQRGISQTDALKGTKKSGAVITSSGAVVTVVPEAWAASLIYREGGRQKESQMYFQSRC